MLTIDWLVLNLTEVRRRSLRIWDAVPPEQLNWRPTPDAMSAIELIRHVLEDDFFYAQIIESGGALPDTTSPFRERAVTTIADDLTFAAPFREKLLATVRGFRDEDLATRQIVRADRGYTRTAGDFIMRVAYHDALHAGQLMMYLRMMGVQRPDVWD